MLKIYRTAVEGEKRGKVIGFPTLNFLLKKTDKIKRGVWVVKLKNGEKSYFGVANVGRAKTFQGAMRTAFSSSPSLRSVNEEKIEVHLLTEPAENIKRAELHFLKYLRETKKFKAIGDLKKQIKKDINDALCFLELSEKKEK